MGFHYCQLAGWLEEFFQVRVADSFSECARTRMASRHPPSTATATARSNTIFPRSWIANGRRQGPSRRDSSRDNSTPPWSCGAPGADRERCSHVWPLPWRWNDPEGLTLQKVQVGMAETTIGERIRALRRGTYTQHDLAAAADVSVDVIRKLEQGRRQTASIATLARIARALGVELAELLGPSRPAPVAGEPPTPVVAIRDALTSVDDLLGELDDVEVLDLIDFGRAVTYCFGLYWAGRYGQLAALLPGLLTEAAAATHRAAASEMGPVADLAAQVHRIAASTLLHFGASDLGYIAAREALRLAARAPDPLRAAAMRCTLGHVLMRQGRFLDAERVCVATAEQVQPRGEASPAQLSVFGGVLLRGAAAAARQGVGPARRLIC